MNPDWTMDANGRVNSSPAFERAMDTVADILRNHMLGTDPRRRSEIPMPETPKTQTAAPPIVPPKRPIVGTSLADDADARRRQFADFPRQMDDIQRDLAVAAAIARLRRRLYPPAGPDHDA